MKKTRLSLTETRLWVHQSQQFGHNHRSVGLFQSDIGLEASFRNDLVQLGTKWRAQFQG
jgi:hypothetical protein